MPPPASQPGPYHSEKDIPGLLRLRRGVRVFLGTNAARANQNNSARFSCSRRRTARLLSHSRCLSGITETATSRSLITDPAYLRARHGLAEEPLKNIDGHRGIGQQGGRVGIARTGSDRKMGATMKKVADEFPLKIAKGVEIETKHCNSAGCACPAKLV